MTPITHPASVAAATSPARTLCAALAVALALAIAPTPSTAKGPATAMPTVILVHGAFAESSSWQGPVILVGHSWGGSVISNAAAGRTQVKALIYAAGFAPESGESAAMLTGKFPGGTLGPTLAQPVTLADGGKDLYIQQDKFHAQFAADLPARTAKLMAATQRPITEAALNEPSGMPAWKQVPSWFIYGSLDKNIPPAVQSFMAQCAGAKKTVVVKGASHVVTTSHPEALVKLIDEAAAYRTD